ncbi:MAG TPA: divalent metal cation transporter [Acidimicrobiia bacterium]|nr:divalent metal cation transporter [Acidimicrobiia bacterium]
MKKVFGVTLGILTAMGGFVDIGDLVANSATGARYGMSLAWAVVLGVVGIIVFAEMAGRVASVTQRAVFDLVRERLGARAGLVNLGASFFITMLTLIAEVAGVALSFQLVSDVNYLLFIPLVGFAVWLVIWRVKFTTLETVFGLMGLAMIVTIVAVVQLHPSWSSLWHHASHPTVPPGEGHPTYFYFAIALFGAAMTPYEVFFFSSGAVEEKWTRSDLVLNKANVYLGFPLGGLLSLSLMAGAAVVFHPLGVGVDFLSQVALPTSLALGKVGLAFVIVGFVACTFGAALETALSCGYTMSQYFGWQWGKLVRPREAARFHLVVVSSIVVAVVVGVTAIDPIKVTEYSIVLSAAALPLTYFPILVVANDANYMGDDVNGPVRNAIATFYMVLLTVVAAATIPLMIATKAGS